MKKTWILFLFLLAPFLVKGQELMANVQVFAPQVPNIDRRTVETLQTNIRNFLNTNKWTDDVYLPQEKIICNFIITITAWDGGSGFKAEAQIQSNRPVYASGYSTALLNFSDKEFDFNYIEGQALDFSEQNYLNSLSSLLGFYAYAIIGLDKDSFSPLGGTEMFSKALTVVNYSQNTGTKGWKAADGLRNRFWMSQNFIDNGFRDLRTFIYQYHRLGLDLIQNNANQAPKLILSLLPGLQKLDRQKLGAVFPNIFLSTKSDEILNILKMADLPDKIKGFNLMVEVDPANQAKYQTLLQQ